MTNIKTSFATAFALFLSLQACSKNETAELPCPKGGIGSSPDAGDEIVNWRNYKCTTPQICPDTGFGIIQYYVINPKVGSETLAFRLTNCSGATLEISKVELLGNDRCFFTKPEVDSIKIEPGKEAVVRTTYKPTSVGEDHAQIVVTSNAENFNPLRIPICGRGVNQAPAGTDAGVADSGSGSQSNFVCKEVTNASNCGS